MIAGILLAAGQSRRFGADKLLQALPGGTPMALRSAQHLAAAVDRLIVVVPPQAGVLTALLGDLAQPVVNDHAAQGIGTSLACGVRAAANADGWLIALADMPFIDPLTTLAVAAALRAGAPLVAPACNGRTGHPVGFQHDYYGELSGLRGDRGARALLQRDRHLLAIVPVDDAGIHQDIDTPDDLRRATAAHYAAASW